MQPAPCALRPRQLSGASGAPAHQHSPQHPGRRQRQRHVCVPAATAATPEPAERAAVASAAPATAAAAAVGSSWNAKEAGGGRGGGADYLSELGQGQNYNINVDHGQNLDHLDYLFTGELLGHKSDIADGSLRAYEFRSFNNIVGDYYLSPRFLEKVAIHIAKNYLADQGAIKARVPLILGIWGAKGMGKTFQTELAFKKLGCEAVIMSAGELENEWAGTPGRLIRERYRKAADRGRVRGKLAVLLINDIDAGIGRFDNTQVTVNNQMVVGTLMNLCDDPNRCSTAATWRGDDIIRRVPIIVTGNDLSTLFAPLVRDGRMDKFYWQPEHDDLVAILHQMYKDDGLSREDMGAVLRRFPAQPLDFFGALRASAYDGQIRDWIVNDVVGGEIREENANMKELGPRLLAKRDLPHFEPLELTLDMLVKEGERLEMEQEQVNRNKLSKEYLKPQRKLARGLIGLQG